MANGASFTLTIPWLGAQFPDLSDIDLLTQGGQKLVFGARHPTDGQVVLKLMRNNDPEEIRREVLAVSQVASPRVPRVIENGVISTPLGNCFWLREQRIDGHTVRERLQRGPLSVPEVLKLGRHTLETLVMAERVTIVHRDVKPENMMLDRAGDCWLLDFGLARHLALDSQTATVLPFGKVTWGYSPPEQCRNIKPAIDARADLFALGVTIYECATGMNPFRSGTADPLEMLRRVENDPLPPLVLPIQSPERLRDFVAALTQKRRDHRPRTTQEALDWLEEICRDEGV